MSGLRGDSTSLDFRQGLPATSRRLPGLHKSATLTLKPGVAKRTTLTEWRTAGTTRR